MDPFSSDGGKLSLLSSTTPPLIFPPHRAPQHPLRLPPRPIPIRRRLRHHASQHHQQTTRPRPTTPRPNRARQRTNRPRRARERSRPRTRFPRRSRPRTVRARPRLGLCADRSTESRGGARGQCDGTGTLRDGALESRIEGGGARGVSEAHGEFGRVRYHSYPTLR